MTWRRSRETLLLAAMALVICGRADAHEDLATVSIRGHELTLRLLGPRGGRPCIVSSGDGGWIHLAPRVARILSARGYFVVGFDTRAYLASFTSRSATLAADQVPGDYRALIAFASAAKGQKPLLVGVSEGAGLSVLAAGDGSVKASVAGVIGLGLGDRNELAWRWRDVVTYLTKAIPDEPLFSAAAIIDRVAPLPVAVLNATHDEYVSPADIEMVMSHAREPKRLLLIPASDHAFSDAQEELERRLVETIAWIDGRR